MMYIVDHNESDVLCIYLIYSIFVSTVEQSLLVQDLKNYALLSIGGHNVLTSNLD